MALSAVFGLSFFKTSSLSLQFLRAFSSTPALNYNYPEGHPYRKKV